MKKILFLSVIIMVFGCMKTVQMCNSTLPKSETAELIVPDNIRVLEFDGRTDDHKDNVWRMSGGGNFRPKKSIICIGHHYIVVTVWDLSMNRVRLEFDALAGKKYEIKYQRTTTSTEYNLAYTRTTGTIRIWVEEIVDK